MSTVLPFPSRAIPDAPASPSLSPSATSSAAAPSPGLALESLALSLRRFGIELTRFQIADLLMGAVANRVHESDDLELLHQVMGIIAADAPPDGVIAAPCKASRRST